MTRGWLASHTVTQAVERMAWVLVAGGVLMALTPARVPRVFPVDASVRSPVARAVAPPVRAVPGASWLAANPFAMSRRAPARRWLVNDTTGASPEGAGAAVVPDVPRLFGTMVGANGSSALLRLDAAQTAARLYMVGERGGAYTVRRILDDVVILEGPSGRVELRLRRGEARP